MLGGLRVLLVGDGWERYARAGVEVRPTQPLAETYRLHRHARTVVCLQRVHGDCSDGPVEPATVNRGFMEGGVSAARVFVDASRPRHAFDPGDVIWYRDPDSLAEKIKSYLKGWNSTDNTLAQMFAEKCRLIYTYRARLARIFNCVRAPRFLAEIP
jgi:hypothetical protein